MKRLSLGLVALLVVTLGACSSRRTPSSSGPNSSGSASPTGARVAKADVPRLALAGAVTPASERATARGAVTSATAPLGWKRRVNPPWIWWAPSGWIAAHGANDLNISSPTGALWNKYGASAALTVTPKQWFDYLRNNYLIGSRHGQGFYSRALRTTRFTAVGAIQTISSQYGYYRQRATFVGTLPSGASIGGEMIMDYFYVDAFRDAGELFQVRSGPTKNLASSLTLLRRVQSLIFYCGSVC